MAVSEQSKSGGSTDTPGQRYSAALAAEIETKWQGRWERERTFAAANPGQAGFDPSRPKYYVLDMFPYPSGDGLHVGHPEGYTATDIVARYMRMRGRNVLHPMGWDAFGLPAEQHAVRTGVHPAITTRKAMDTFRRQLKRFGFSYDWSREIATIDPDYYKWTQWIFLRIYSAWYDKARDRARPIGELVAALEEGVYGIDPSGELVSMAGLPGGPGGPPLVIAGEPVGVRMWHELSQEERRAFIDSQRLAYLGEQTVNWCPKLGTVLANEEVKDGRSERGGYPVYRRSLKQWMFRITAYAERLVADLSTVDWPESTRTMQTEWIGRSEGAEIDFDIEDGPPGGSLGGSPLRGEEVASAGSSPGRGDTPRTGVAPASVSISDVVDRLSSGGRLRPVGFIARDPYPPGVSGAVSDLVRTQRNLPHFNLPGATYFVDWKTHEGVELSEAERDAVLSAMLHFDGERCRVYAAVVMSNHVHWLVRPFEGHSLDELVKSVKHFTATQINKSRGASGHFWDGERFDHVVRNAEYFSKFVRYIYMNPVEAGVVRRPEEYPWTFVHAEAVGGVAARQEGEGAAGHAAERRATRGSIRVYTTRPDTIFGATYMVIAPEHPLVEEAISILPEREAGPIFEYVHAAKNKSDVDRQAEAKDKTGVFSGLYATNPATGERIPVWIADYVLMGYGHGAIMAVPGHDERDYEFAKKFGLRIVEVVARPGGAGELPYSGDGVAVNSSGEGVSLDGLPTAEAKSRIIAWLEEGGIGRRKVNYKLRDWLFSRQRYWGEPFPIVYDEAGNHYPVSESALPVRLPEMEQYKPPESEEPAPMLAAAPAWINTTAGEAGVDPALLPPATPVRREANTMPNWAGSCWYYLRFADPRNAGRFIGREAEGYWMGPGGVDLYIGGSEHAVLHLLYARFWHKVLFDLGEVSSPEPMRRLFHQGMITSFAYQRADKSLVPVDHVEEAPGGGFVEKGVGTPVVQTIAKMSKALKNVINPDDVIAEYGADTMRLYEMYMGPLEASKPWNPRDITGMFRFLQKAWRMVIDEATGAARLAERADEAAERELHRTIARIGPQIEKLSFNTAIADLIKFVNAAPAAGLSRSQAERFALILAPFAPHIAEEMWSRLGHAGSLAHEPWPTYDEGMLRDSTVEIPVQVNGKLRERVTVAAGADAKALEAAGLEAARPHIEGKSVKKVIVVPGKLVNVVVA